MNILEMLSDSQRKAHAALSASWGTGANFIVIDLHSGLSQLLVNEPILADPEEQKALAAALHYGAD